MNEIQSELESSDSELNGNELESGPERVISEKRSDYLTAAGMTVAGYLAGLGAEGSGTAVGAITVAGKLAYDRRYSG